MIIHMPDGRDLVVDVKTPLDAYLAAMEAASDEQRAVALRRHAQHVAERVRLLSSKNYAAQFPRRRSSSSCSFPATSSCPQRSTSSRTCSSPRCAAA
jgi:hypothetical protein